jgi:hypothetical protein
VTSEDSAVVPPPQRTPLTGDAKKQKLHENVKDALRALPIYYTSQTFIEGLESADLFSLNSVLGGSIEIQVVETLNRVRQVWDPDDEWPEHRFERQSQSFPDVRLVSRSSGALRTELGIELKGWYLLSKEREPSFRYTVTPAACDAHDLLVVVPWHLKNVLSGVPVVYEPYIEQARYAAEYRNYYWQHQRTSTPVDKRGLTPPGGTITPYMPPKSKSSDKADHDSGGNFGRVARVHGLMDSYTQRMLQTRVSGIEAAHWVNFFRAYADARGREDVAQKLDRLLGAQIRANAKGDDSALEEAFEALLHKLGSSTGT